MAIFNRMSAQEIQETFKYKGLLFGCIPVYVSDIHSVAPVLVARNWVPEWLLNLTSELYFFFFNLVDPQGLHERTFPIMITGTTHE